MPQNKTLFLLAELERLSTSDEANKTLCMTQATILFEGLYRHLSVGALESDFQKIRAQRWEYHFGTPTVTFLLSFKAQIDKATKLFDELAPEQELPDTFPWVIASLGSLSVDRDNGIATDPKSISLVDVPATQGKITKIF